MQITELFAQLGVKINKTEWEGARSRISDLRKNFLNLKTAIIAGTVGLVYFEDRLGNFSGKLLNTSQILQMPVKQLQALKLASKEAFVPFQEVSSAVTGLQTTLANYRTGQGLPENIQMGLGMLRRASGQVINPNDAKNGYQLFSRIAQALGKVKNTQLKEGILNQLFGNSDLLPLIGKGMGGIQKAYNQLKSRNLFFSDKDLQRSKMFAQQMALLNTQFKQTFMELGMKLMPVFNQFAQQMIKMGKDKDFLNMITDLAKAVGLLAEGLAKVLIYIDKFARFIGKTGGDALVGLEKMTGTFVAKNSVQAVLTPYAQQRLAQLHNSNNSNTVNNNTNNKVTNNTYHMHSGTPLLSSHITGNMR